MSLEILKSKFGKGYQTDSEEKHAFALSDDRVRYDKNGAGGAVKVAGYKGIWPLFGNPKERLGGPDLIAFKDSTSSKEAEASGSKLKDNFYDKQSHQLQGIHFAKRPEWMCRPRSGCKPCDRSELYRPYCQPHGNRILIECRKIEATKPPERKPLDGANVQPPPPPPSTSNDITTGKDAKPAEDTGAKGALDEMLAHPIPVDKDNPILPKPFVPIVDDKFAHIMEETGAMGALNGRSIDDLQQFGDIFLESRSENLLNVELRPRDELFVSGHVYKGYQICGRDQAREAKDYAEFLGVNLILALVGIYILLNRQRFLAGEHRSMLARRIGRT